MSKGMERSEFIDIMNQAVGCYIYFCDNFERMHFVANTGYKIEFCSSLDNAYVGYEDEAKSIKDLCNLLYPDKDFHIVETHPVVEWL